MDRNKVPVTIITGFLGAGKTTFLNHIIEAHPDKKFAIIENEFGDIPIDQELVINAEDGIFELANGCICCTLNVELGMLLKKLTEGNYNFNHLLIETTGIAEPDGIASAFIGTNKSTKFILDGTICLADAQDILKNLAERGEAHKQVAFADAILLNKTDLVKSDELKAAREKLDSINSEALIVETSFAKIKENLLQLHAYDSDQIESKFLNPHHQHRHNELAAHSFEFSEPIIPERFEHWINMLLFLSGYQLYRIKGILNLSGESRKVIFQSVRSSSKIEMGSRWQQGEYRKSKLVFIGSNIKREALAKGLDGCKVK